MTDQTTISLPITRFGMTRQEFRDFFRSLTEAQRQQIGTLVTSFKTPDQQKARHHE